MSVFGKRWKKLALINLVKKIVGIPVKNCVDDDITRQHNKEVEEAVKKQHAVDAAMERRINALTIQTRTLRRKSTRRGGR